MKIGSDLKWFEHPGVAAKDPETGRLWRLLGDGQWRLPSGESAAPKTVARLHVAGPHLDDLATVGVLFLTIRDYDLVREGDVWETGPVNGRGSDFFEGTSKPEVAAFACREHLRRESQDE